MERDVDRLSEEMVVPVRHRNDTIVVLRDDRRCAGPAKNNAEGKKRRAIRRHCQEKLLTATAHSAVRGYAAI